MSDATVENDTVQLSIPAMPEWLALARTTGAAVASRWQFTYDEIADLRLAIDELCLSLIGVGDGDGSLRLQLAYSLEGSSLVVRGSVRVGSSPAGGVRAGSSPTGSAGDRRDHAPSISDAAELSERILDALVDDHGSQSGDSEHRAWLRKERSVAVT